MAKYADKWKKTFPESIGNEIRPADGVDNTQAYNTDAMPQYMANDPVRFDLQNAINSQLVSNDERLKEKIDKTNVDLSAHDKNPKAHTTGIAGNAASATKLQTARTLALSGKAAGSATFDGTANASINVTAVTADTASKLSTPRTISLGGNATGSANFDGSNNVTINTTVNQAAHANNADTATTANKANTATNVAWSGVTGKPNLALKDGDTIYTNDWFRSRGDTGWYNESYGGGWYMTDSTWIRAFNNKNVYTPAKMQADGGFYGNLQGNATTADKGNWKGRNDNNWYQMAFSLGNEFNWNSTGAFRYNPANNVLQVGTVQGNITGNAGSANVGKALQVFDGNNNAINSTFHWVGQDGQPTWLWGSNDGSNAYVYNPSNFRVSYATNANSAVNADTVDGYHASDLLRTLGGNRTPVMTDIFDRAGTIDLSAMNATAKANDKAKIDKSRNSLQNIWNTSTGIVAYGGDIDMSGGYNRGTLKLTQSYKNFDKILVVATNDGADIVFHKLWNVYELAYMFSHSYRFSVCDCAGLYWYLFGSVRTGTATNYVLSTDTIWNCNAQNCGIVAIYGIKY